MTSTKSLLAFVGLGLVANAAYADGPLPELPLPLYGSATLFDVGRQIRDACGLEGFLSYRPLESSRLVGKAMGPSATTFRDPVIPAHNQQIAPQARFLNAVECNAVGPNAGTGIAIGMDGIAVVADDQPETNDCNTLRYSDAHHPTIAGYTFTDWRDVLRILYTGQSSKVTFAPCSAINSAPSPSPSSPGPIIGRCDSELRRTLVASWGNLFETACTNGKCPSGLRHAWRPATSRM